MHPTRDTHELDRLRLIGLGRIPRCARCPRFEALVSAHAVGAKNTPGRLPAPPASCLHHVCDPLAARLRPQARPERPQRVALPAINESHAARPDEGIPLPN